MMMRALVIGLVAAVGLVVTPAAPAKFGMTLLLGKRSPHAGQPFTVSLRTDLELPPDHELQLVAVAPGTVRSDVLGAVTGASSTTTAVVR